MRLRETLRLTTPATFPSSVFLQPTGITSIIVPRLLAGRPASNIREPAPIVGKSRSNRADLSDRVPKRLDYSVSLVEKSTCTPIHCTVLSYITCNSRGLQSRPRGGELTHDAIMGVRILVRRGRSFCGGRAPGTDRFVHNLLRSDCHSGHE